MLPYLLKGNATFAEISEKDINLTNRTEYIREARAKYDSYDRDEWKKDGDVVHIGKSAVVVTGFDDKTGGYVVVHKGHRFDPDTGFFEIITANILSANGYSVEMMDETSFSKTQYDINVNGHPTEIKVMSGFRNIHKRAEDASFQGAKRIVYYIKFDNDFEMHKRFSNVYRTIGSIDEIWYIKNNKLHYLKKENKF
jgi:hypothetical protein